MSNYQPDVWVIVKIEDTQDSRLTVYKVLAGWYGGYAGSDEWRLNSGIKSYVYDEKSGSIDFFGYSMSAYYCHTNNEKFSGLTSSIFANYVKQAESYSNVKITHISFDDFVKEFPHKIS